MGKQNLKTVFMIVSTVIILLFTTTMGSMETSAKSSDFIIEDGILKQYLGSDKEIIIPNGVKTIGTNAFKDCKMEKVLIPDGVSLIEDGAFLNCSKLTEIVIPDSVEELGQSTFQGCSSLYRAKLSSKAPIGMSAFEDCTSLNEVIIPDGVPSLSHYSFRNCTNLEMIDLPDSVSFIGEGCFENCTSLETILFPTQETFVGYKALYNTLWLTNYDGDYVIINQTLIQYRGRETNIIIPNQIKIIGNGAFENCSFITNVTIPMGVKEIGNSAFAGCTGLSEIVLPDSITRVYSYSFGGCSNLAKITIPKDVNIRRDSLEGTKWMTDCQDDFIILNGNLLGYQGSEAKVSIPDSVITVCTGAFSSNDTVAEITVPTSVTKIYYAGFFLCKNLQKVYITNKNTYIDYEAFFSCHSNFTIYGIVGGPVEEYAHRNNVPFINYGMNKAKVTLYLDGEHTTSLSVSGAVGDVQWVSEDSSIVKVNNTGKVTAVNTGTTKVNAIVNGITMTCQITVKTPFISKSSVSIMIGKTSRLNVVGISSTITWSSSDKSIATVSSTGVITANKAGSAIITATANGKKYTCTITVK
ncbi:MAG: hypothetical protein K0S47_1609 [Herbinix sp.]|jgi:hypothetical protein|nr:hypothetical protein [Herbinix sp.]